MPNIFINNARIQDISSDRNNTLITVRYRQRMNNQQNEQTLRLVAGPQTVILDTNGRRASARDLSRGMTIDAVVSEAMTRSIPPQTNALLIQIVRRNQSESFTTGRILNIDRRNRYFTTISDGNTSSIVRFNVNNQTMYFNRTGRRMDFDDLREGMRVRVRHSNAMTASIPPQSTAFEVRVL